MYSELIPNQCESGGGGCSVCLVDGEYVRCKYGIKNSATNLKTCSFWKFSEYCDNVTAQKAADSKYTS